MASTKKTTFFGLNQWEPDDMVKHEDFNADNLIIDTALSTIPFQLITDHVVSEATATVTLDLSELDLTHYRFLLVSASGKIDGNGFYDSEYIRLRINDDASSVYTVLDSTASDTQPTTGTFSCFMPSASSENGGGGALAYIYPGGNTIVLSSEGVGFRSALEAGRYFCRYTGCSFAEMDCLVFSNFTHSASLIQPGFHITVWGMGV